jgi:phage baseplate assembly protein W
MLQHFYRTPLNFGHIAQGMAAPKCGAGESISQVLFLLICTRKGEMPGEPEFGCEIWNLQFEQFNNARLWEDVLESSLQSGIEKFEPRLHEVTVRISVREVEVSYPFREYPDIKHQASIQVQAKLRHSGERFSFSTAIFVSPIAG